MYSYRLFSEDYIFIFLILGRINENFKAYYIKTLFSLFIFIEIIKNRVWTIALCSGKKKKVWWTCENVGFEFHRLAGWLSVVIIWTRSALKPTTVQDEIENIGLERQSFKLRLSDASLGGFFFRTMWYLIKKHSTFSTSVNHHHNFLYNFQP